MRYVIHGQPLIYDTYIYIVRCPNIKIRQLDAAEIEARTATDINLVNNCSYRNLLIALAVCRFKWNTVGMAL